MVSANHSPGYLTDSLEKDDKISNPLYMKTWLLHVTMDVHAHIQMGMF